MEVLSGETRGEVNIFLINDVSFAVVDRKARATTDIDSRILSIGIFKLFPLLMLHRVGIKFEPL